MEGWQRSGALELHVAESHADPKHMVFAQHLMAERGAELWDLIYNQNAHVFICGHKRLGDGVDAVIRDLCLRGFGGDAVKAKTYYDALFETQR